MIGKSPDIKIDWASELKNANPEETGIVENAEKEIETFGRYQIFPCSIYLSGFPQALEIMENLENN